MSGKSPVPIKKKRKRMVNNIPKRQYIQKKIKTLPQRSQIAETTYPYEEERLMTFLEDNKPKEKQKKTLLP